MNEKFYRSSSRAKSIITFKRNIGIVNIEWPIEVVNSERQIVNE